MSDLKWWQDEMRSRQIATLDALHDEVQALRKRVCLYMGHVSCDCKFWNSDPKRSNSEWSACPSLYQVLREIRLAREAVEAGNVQIMIRYNPPEGVPLSDAT